MEEEKKVCCLCGEELQDYEEFVEYEGKFYCLCCAEDRFTHCELCDAVYPVEQMTYWGEFRICPVCLEDKYPTYDQKLNEWETQEEYDAMCRAYIGRKTKYNEACLLPFSWDECDEDILYYNAEVQIGDDGRIASISRLTCEVMLSETVKSSDLRPYWVSEDDYPRFAKEYLDPILEEEAE